MAEINIEKMGKKVAEEALDGYIYKGKTLREWIDILAQTQWIPVSERLPEEFQRVLVTIVNYKGDKIVRVAEYYSRNNGKGIFQIKENYEEWKVGEKGLLAWMSLPKPFEQ